MPGCIRKYEETIHWRTGLGMPDHSKPFQIESDMSKYATGAVLSQLDSNSNRHPVASYSKTFSPAEQNYDIHDRELLAIIWALDVTTLTNSVFTDVISNSRWTSSEFV